MIKENVTRNVEIYSLNCYYLPTFGCVASLDGSEKWVVFSLTMRDKVGIVDLHSRSEDSVIFC